MRLTRLVEITQLCRCRRLAVGEGRKGRRDAYRRVFGLF